MKNLNWTKSYLIIVALVLIVSGGGLHKRTVLTDPGFIWGPWFGVASTQYERIPQ